MAGHLSVEPMPGPVAPSLAVWALAATLAMAGPARAQDDISPLAARSLAATCANCHGPQGAARAGMAVLAGRPVDETWPKLAAFRSGALPSTVMGQLARGYTEAELRAVAAWYAALPPPAPTTAKPTPR